MQAVEELIARIGALVEADDEAGLEEAKRRLLALLKGTGASQVRELVDQAARGALLEVRWELEEVLEAATPKKAPEKPSAQHNAPARPEQDPQDDLVLVYDDPRGLLLHRNRAGTRWFATQIDPNTGQPATFEVPPHQVAAIKQQLAGSPYWVLGAGR
jgi:hypothetical protein